MLKTAKQILAVLLALLCMSTGISVTGSAASAMKPGSVGQLWLTTDGKAKTLKLSWDKASNATGYQIYRSTTGKSGSFQKVAATKGTYYTDKDLASSTTYYYKVRAYAKQNGKSVYGAFSKENLSTRITKAFAQKQLQAAYKVADYWLSPELKNCDLSITVPAGKKAHVDCYHPVKGNKFQTKEQLKEYLNQYFAWQFLDEAVEAVYMEKDGKLYMGEVGYGDAASHNYQHDRVDYIWQKDGYATVLVIEEHEDFEGKFEIPYPHGLYYENGRWVFGEEDGIRSYGRLNYWNFWEAS